MRIARLFVVFLILTLFSASTGHADLIYFKNGNSSRGMVIEEYKDRIVFSTVDGEITIEKKRVDRVEYDDPEMNIMTAGDNAFEKGKYKTAYRYYSLAHEINSDSGMITKKMDQAFLLAFKEKETYRRDLMDKLTMLEGTGQPAAKELTTEEMLKEKLGIVLSRTPEGRFKIAAMSINSPFREAGFKLGDFIISVWSRMSSYISLEELARMFLAEDQHTIKIVLRRNIKFKKEMKERLGAKFDMEWDGMTTKKVLSGGVSDLAGLEENDVIIAVNNKSIRYTKMKSVLRLLNNVGRVDVTIQRNVTVFRPGR